MVAAASEPVKILRNLPRFIYITGCDGTGKTTQARLLLAQLQSAGVKTRHVWLRFPFFFSLPLMAYARLRSYSWVEVSDGVRHGYWDFRRSWLMKNVFPWVLLVDAALAGLWKIYIPLWMGRTVVCERFVLDMLVDLAVAFKDQYFYSGVPGILFFRLLPASAKIVLLDLDPATIMKRRADLVADRLLDERREAFRKLGISYRLTVLSSFPTISQVNHEVLEQLI